MNGLFLIAALGGERVAIQANEVESVVEIESVAPVPLAAAHVAGLAALRSRVLTVIDCRASLGLGATPLDLPCDAVVVVVDGHPYGLLVEGVEDVVEQDGRTGPVPASLAPPWRRVAKGAVEVGDNLVLLVDSRALLAGPGAAAA